MQEGNNDAMPYGHLRALSALYLFRFTSTALFAYTM